MKLSRAIQGYWLEKRLNLSPNTITGYEVIFRRFVQFLNDAKIDRITSNDVREFLFAYLPDEYKQRTSKSLGKK
ncbi:hypothetical protein BH10CHL1_BH10CHL1_20770 [soil metagenome]